MISEMTGQTHTICFQCKTGLCYDTCTRCYKCLYKELLQNAENLIEEISYCEKDIGYDGVILLVLDHLSGWIDSDIVSLLEDKIEE